MQIRYCIHVWGCVVVAFVYTQSVFTSTFLLFCRNGKLHHFPSELHFRSKYSATDVNLNNTDVVNMVRYMSNATTWWEVLYVHCIDTPNMIQLIEICHHGNVMSKLIRNVYGNEIPVVTCKVQYSTALTWFK